MTKFTHYNVCALTIGVATLFPELQFYSNPIVNFKFYRGIPILNPYIFPKSLCVIHSLKKVESLDLGPSYLALWWVSWMKD